MTPAERIARLKELAEKAPSSFSASTHHDFHDIRAFYEIAVLGIPWLIEQLEASAQRERDAFERGAQAMREAARRIALESADLRTAALECASNEYEFYALEDLASVARDIANSIEDFALPQDSDAP